MFRAGTCTMSTPSPLDKKKEKWYQSQETLPISYGMSMQNHKSHLFFCILRKGMFGVVSYKNVLEEKIRPLLVQISYKNVLQNQCVTLLIHIR